MTPADTAIAEAPDPVGAMGHEDYYKVACIACRVLVWAAIHCPMMFVSAHKGAGSPAGCRGRWYIDYVGGAGTLILGHAFPTVVDAIKIRQNVFIFSER